jgi:outer membrane protein TolC
VTYLDVLTAQEAALEAEVEAVEAALGQRLRAIAVYRALGGGLPDR